MEGAVIVLAAIVACLVAWRFLRSDGREAARVGSAAHVEGAVAVVGPDHLPATAFVLDGRPQLRIFTALPTELRSGLPAVAPASHYALTLSKSDAHGWTSVLRAPLVASDGDAITVTLVVPWADLAERYDAVNLVVR